jgi:hypothetical protein
MNLKKMPVAQYSLAHLRPWAPSPAPQNDERKKNPKPPDGPIAAVPMTV